MSNKEMKPYACMAYRQPKNGFTFFSALLTLSILSICLPFLGYLISAADYNSNYSEISVQQFFHFVQDDFIRSSSAETNGRKLYLQQDFADSTVTLEQYGSTIRRQIDGQGHEIFLREVKEVTFHPLPHGIQVSVITTTGEKHEKSIILYQ
ncbi:ComGF family competence protein [Oceanobacillus massiliensis]|uniref:ComGF family competence protein n=1 Tax=Oceanobacillus massiliensis TaxID=1465765 RepID=UPI0009DA39B7|nr:ComGF family competence protein [Oceanobacillus massiliensis]